MNIQDLLNQQNERLQGHLERYRGKKAYDKLIVNIDSWWRDTRRFLKAKNDLVWHDSSERPELDSYVLVVTPDSFDAARYIGSGAFNNNNGYIEYANYKWAYLSDLLPDKD